MTQHNNNLSLHRQGKDVALLHSRLTALGYTIATSEILGERFGESTQQAVIQFQRAEGLTATGSFDGATAQAIMSRFEAVRTVIKHTPLSIHLPTTLPPGEPTNIFLRAFSRGTANEDNLYLIDAKTLEIAWIKAAEPST